MSGSIEEDVKQDKVAYWEVPLNSGLYKIEFEHGTTTGKRIIRVNGKEIFRKDWMFKLVGNEEFNIGKNKCKIKVDPVGMFAYRYLLEVDGKPFRKFVERQSKILKTWTLKSPGNGGEDIRVVLEKDTLDIWVNGTRVVTEREFCDGGTKTHFEFSNHPGTLHALCTGIRKQPIIYSLTFNGEEIPGSKE